MAVVVAACVPRHAIVHDIAAAPAGWGAIAAKDWKALVVGGADDRPIYDFAAEDLAGRLRDAGVSRVALHTASLTAPDGSARPPARLSSLRQSLSRLGSRQGEACLLFFSSHGEEGMLRLAGEPNGRRASPADIDRLATAACGDRPTVLVLSGCETGSFITARLERPNRIIIAAAARGRATYAAKLDERHGAFDRCLIGAYDSGAGTWRELFARVLPCVAEREAWLGVPASRPQASFGAAVADLRLPAR
ncbi:MAG: hypothetical protein KF889_03495 [Alphaproteobacteria bacterium]|nr:hypothetical protein [Alphaproteobacteria bacterium]MCW5741974.1 hypothetical protein [Alphaproteobacteria bacterium]